MHPRTVIEEKVDHLQEDVTGLKADVKRLDGKIDSVSASLTEHRIDTEKSFGKLRDEMNRSIATLRTEMKDSIAEVKDSVAALRNDMTASIAELRAEMKDSIAKLHGSHTSQIAWMVSTVIAATGAAITATKFFAAP